LVGRPVLGPPRCTSTTTSGSSVITARPNASPLRANPGPLVPVAAHAPEKAAPIDEVTAAISSSAWKVLTPSFMNAANSSNTVLAGVIG
jgi:hypothetical protein